MYKVIATGSKGNAVLYHGLILVDCGVPYDLIRPYVNQIQIVLLTHSHKDHINLATLSRLAFERPSLRVGCCDWMLEIIQDKKIRNVDLFQIGQYYNYGAFQVCPVKLYHDVPNCGYRIRTEGINGTKIFHATDTAHLDGITARNYDLYAIEHNYNEDTVFDVIAKQEAKGQFAHQKGAINTHLSEQQARDFIFKNKKSDSTILRLHESGSQTI